MKKKQFKSESKRLLDLMINSIYSNKEIFLREIISNASDAIDKLYYKSLTDKKIKINRKDLEIKLSVSEEENTLTISDNGCGMTYNELENNLGIIAESGSLAFKNSNDDNENVDIIGQFGVGFYSAFMVSEKITVLTKSIEDDKAYKWESSGADGYIISETEKEDVGTDIILTLRKDTEEEKYSEYLTEYKIRTLVKKYSDYIRYPIKMEVTNRKLKNKSKDEYEEVKEVETLNSMIPLWKKNSSEVTEEELNNFYSDKFYDYEKPLKVIQSSVEGLCSYKALLFIPAHAPYDYYTKEYEKGLSLYSNGVLIMDKCSDLLPDYFGFVKGVIDTEDVSLNISREMLQKTKSISLIAKSIESKIRKELEEMLKEDRENYEKFFEAFGMQIKYGVYSDYGMNKDKLQDLLLFTSSKTKKLITLNEYIDNMKDDQKDIYYASGSSFDSIDSVPQVEKVKEKDYEILYLTDYVDEFVINSLMEYKEKKFMNVSSEELDLNSEEEKEAIKKVNEENTDLLKNMKDILEITDVRFTNKLKNHPVCLVSKGNVSIEMEKVLNAMPTDEKIEAQTILEINNNHPIADKIKSLYNQDKEEFEKYSKVIYAQAKLIEGLPLDNPSQISNIICDIISK